MSKTQLSRFGTVVAKGRARLMNIITKRHSGDLGTWEKDLASVYHTCSQPHRDSQPDSVKREGFRRLMRIAQMANDYQLNQLEQKHLLWSALGLFCFFRLQHKGNERGIRQCKRRRDSERAQRLYYDIIYRVLQGSNEVEVVDSILNYLTEYKIWSREFLAVAVLEKPLSSGASGATVLAQMLDRVQTALLRSAPEARSIIRVLYELLDTYFWPPVDIEAAKVISRLLKMYRTGVRMERDEEYPTDVAGGPLRKGLEVAIRRIIEHMNNSDLMLIIGYMVDWIFDETMTDDTILDFGTVLEHAALVHNTLFYKDTFTHKLFDNLFEIVSSQRSVVSHLGSRILHQLLDRHDNREQFESPKIFFQNTHFNVTVSNFCSEDKAFIKKHRRHIHECLIRAILNHAYDRYNLENIYTTICLLATEVPCGYSAAAIANLAMNIQETARHNITFRPQVQYHLHALVMGIMSLLSWLHNAPDFYKYVNKIINLRAEQAPHLNPPMRIVYTFAQHHVLWDKAELFFDDWEVRYSLWMRFRVKDTQTFLESVGAAGPPTAEMIAQAQSSGLDPSLNARVYRITRRQALRPFLPTAEGAGAAATAEGAGPEEAEEAQVDVPGRTFVFHEPDVVARRQSTSQPGPPGSPVELDRMSHSSTHYFRKTSPSVEDMHRIFNNEETGHETIINAPFSAMRETHMHETNPLSTGRRFSSRPFYR